MSQQQALARHNAPIPPDANVMSGHAGVILQLSGDWVVQTIAPMTEKLERLKRQTPGITALDLNAVTSLDTAGALLVNLSAGSSISIAAENPKYKELLEHAKPVAEETTAKKINPILAMLSSIGQGVLGELTLLWQMIGFGGHFLVTLARVFVRPQNLRLTSVVYHMEQTGVRAVPIVCLLAFLIGMVTSYMGSDQLVQFGAQIYVVDLLVISSFREMAVLITAILVAGRSGSAFTAQIGSMVANEEISAMVSMGIDPMETLVLPRILALTIMLPALLLVADIVAIFGGMVAVAFSIDLSFSTFITRFLSISTVQHFWAGMIKAPFFAMVIGIVGCFLGFQAKGSAESVGRLTTQSVVEGIFLVIALDAVFALFFMAVGI